MELEISQYLIFCTIISLIVIITMRNIVVREKPILFESTEPFRRPKNKLLNKIGIILLIFIPILNLILAIVISVIQESDYEIKIYKGGTIYKTHKFFMKIIRKLNPSHYFKCNFLRKAKLYLININKPKHW